MADEIASLFEQFNKKKAEEPKKPEEKPEEPKKIEEKPEELEKKSTDEPVKSEPAKQEIAEEEVKLAFEPKKKEPENVIPIAFKATPVAKKQDENYDLSPAKPLSKHIIVIFGLKGSGKTSLGLSFPKTHGCLSFDNKTYPIAEDMGKLDDTIIFEGSRYMDKTSPENWLSSADKTWKYLNKILDSIPDDKCPDWLVVDGGEIFHQIAEMVMRYRNNISPFQGISNKNIWKERRMYIDQLLRRCLAKSRKGVIWTSYIDKEEIIKDGDFVARTDVPRWIDAVLWETDVVIKTERDTDKNGQKFYATVESSKWKALPESPKTDVTDSGISKLLKEAI